MKHSASSYDNYAIARKVTVAYQQSDKLFHMEYCTTLSSSPSFHVRWWLVTAENTTDSAVVGSHETCLCVGWVQRPQRHWRTLPAHTSNTTAWSIIIIIIIITLGAALQLRVTSW